MVGEGLPCPGCPILNRHRARVAVDLGKCNRKGWRKGRGRVELLVTVGEGPAVGEGVGLASRWCRLPPLGSTRLRAAGAQVQSGQQEEKGRNRIRHGLRGARYTCFVFYRARRSTFSDLLTVGLRHAWKITPIKIAAMPANARLMVVTLAFRSR